MRRKNTIVALIGVAWIAGFFILTGPARATDASRRQVRACICRVARKEHCGRRDRRALVWIAGRESTWNPWARNGSCLGVFQLAHVARRWARHEWPGWHWFDAADSTRAAIHYCRVRYGSPAAAKAFWMEHGYF